MIGRGAGKADQVRAVSLDALCADPARARALPAQVRSVLLGQCAVVLAALTSAAIAEPECADTVAASDRLLKVEEAARLLGVKPDHLYRSHGDYPFTVHLGRNLRFSLRGIQEWIREQQGAR